MQYGTVFFYRDGWEVMIVLQVIYVNRNYVIEANQWMLTVKHV